MGRSSTSSSSAAAAARVVCSGAGGCVRDYDDDKKNVSEEEEEEEDEEEDSIPAEEVEISAVSPSPPSAGVCALDGRVGLQEGGASAAVGDSREGDNRAAARRARRLTPPRTFEYPIFTPVLSNETSYRNPPSIYSNRDLNRRSAEYQPDVLLQHPADMDYDSVSVWKEVHPDENSFDEEFVVPVRHSNAAAVVNGLHNPFSNNNNNNINIMSPRSSTPLRDYSIQDEAGNGSIQLPIQHLSSSSPQNSMYTIRSPSPAKNLHSHMAAAGCSPKIGSMNGTTSSNFPQVVNTTMSPRIPQQFSAMSPQILQLALSPDLAKAMKNLRDPPLSPITMFPAKHATGALHSSPPPPQVRLSPKGESAGEGLQQHMRDHQHHRHQQQNHHHHHRHHHRERQLSPVSAADRSPRMGWKKPLHAKSPGLSSLKLDAQSAMMGIIGNTMGSRGRSGHGLRGKNSTATPPVPTWAGCNGGQSTVTPALDRDRSTGGSFTDSPEIPSQLDGKRLTPKQPITSGSQSQHHHHKFFSFLHWGKKKAVKLTDSYQSEIGSRRADSDSIKVLDYTIKTLRYKLEQANKKRETAVNEVRALQSAMEILNEKCSELQLRCQDLELQVSLHREQMEEDPELQPLDIPVHVNGRRDMAPASTAAAAMDPNMGHVFSHLELTLQLFSKTVQDAKVSVRKLTQVICHYLRECGESATEVIFNLLKQQKVGQWVNHIPRAAIILYFEAFLNQVMFENFENVSFEPNGTSNTFDPGVLRQTCYKAFQNLKKQEWAGIEKTLGKAQAVVVSANFHRFLVMRMELVLSQLGKITTMDMPVVLMAAFFNAVKSVWLVHHLAFSFDPMVTLFRVAPAADFDPRYMEHVTKLEEGRTRSKVLVMVNPGFVVNRKTIKSQVFCGSNHQ